MDRDPKFYTKAGWLKPYALMCGYIECCERNRVRTTLEAPGGPLYHVKCHGPEGRIAWDTYETLGEARKAYSKLVKEHW